jgi:hypothetical protein
MQKPGFGIAWKIKLAQTGNSPLTPAVLMDRYIGYRGFRSLAFVGGSSDKAIAIDTDLGRVEWQKSLPASSSSASSSDCPSGMTASLTRPTGVAIPTATAGRGGGGGGRGGAKGGVGQPGEGAVTLAEAGQPRGGAGFPGAPAAAGGRGAPGAAPAGRGGGGGRMANFVYALSSDGMLHSMYVSNGDEPQTAVPFLPPNANARGLIVVDNVAYATTHGCGGVSSGVWALDLASKQVSTWKSNGGTLGPAFGPDGILYVTTDGAEPSLMALDPKTLQVKDSYLSGSQTFTSSPVVFDYKGKILAAATTHDGRVHLLDSASLGGADHKTPLYKTPADTRAPDVVSGALASWQDLGGTRWILAPTNGAIVAWKVGDQNGAVTLQPGWVSRDMVSPLTPMVVNDVIFAVSGGEPRAVLYALNSATGKELWNSGNTIGSVVRGGGLSGGGSQLYLGTHDGTLYAFGFPIEH